MKTCIGRDAARRTLCNMQRAGRVEVVGTHHAPRCRRPMNVYGVCARSAKAASGVDELLRVMRHMVAAPQSSPAVTNQDEVCSPERQGDEPLRNEAPDSLPCTPIRSILAKAITGRSMSGSLDSPVSELASAEACTGQVLTDERP